MSATTHLTRRESSAPETEDRFLRVDADEYSRFTFFFYAFEETFRRQMELMHERELQRLMNDPFELELLVSGLSKEFEKLNNKVKRQH